MTTKLTRLLLGAPADVCLVERQDGDEDARMIRGYGAIFYDGTPDTEFELFEGFRERIMPGAFDRALKEDDVRALFNHDVNLLLGRTSAGTMQLSVDEIGLRYVIDPGDTQVGRDTVQHVERRDITGSSFSFIVLDDETKHEDGDRIVEITSVQLFDVGPVTFPAYDATTAELRRRMVEDFDARLYDPALDRELRARRLRIVELGLH